VVRLPPELHDQIEHRRAVTDRDHPAHVLAPRAGPVQTFAHTVTEQERQERGERHHGHDVASGHAGLGDVRPDGDGRDEPEPALHHGSELLGALAVGRGAIAPDHAHDAGP
jgi:hypothetical protein